MSDLAFWMLTGFVLVAGLALVGWVGYLQYREWKLFGDLVLSDSNAAARRLVRQ